MKLHGNIWVYAVKHHVSFSEMKTSSIVSWGISPQKEPHTELEACCTTNHYGHIYLAPLHLSNPELLTYYETINEGRDEAQKEAIKDDYAKLKSIKSNPDTVHEDTKFHCSGHPFISTQYREIDWIIRLYYALNNKLPVNVFLRKSYAYRTNFGALQEIYSCQSSPGFFYFCGAPDLIFTTKKSSVAMHVWDEEDTDMPIPRERILNLPNAAAQVIGGLHFLAASKVIKGVMNRDVPDQLICRALLFKRKDQITLYTISVKIGDVNNTELKVTFKDFYVNDAVLTLGHVCAALKQIYG